MAEPLHAIKKMKHYILFLIFFIVSISTNGQVNQLFEKVEWELIDTFNAKYLNNEEQIEYKDTIAGVEKLLAGIWYLNFSYIEEIMVIDTIYSQTSYKDKLYDSKFILSEAGAYEIFTDEKGKKHNIPIINSGYSRCFELCENGIVECKNELSISCPSLPEVVYYKGIICIMWTDLGGQGLELIEEINSKELVISNKTTRVQYKKIK